MNEPAPIEIHKALADDTRYRLFRYLRLSGRPVPVRELATRLGLHANTIRPHLRRLVDAGLVASETRRGPSAVGRPQTVYTAVAMDNREGRDYRLLADILATLMTGARARAGAETLAREWGDYLMTRARPAPGARRPGPNLAALRDALAEAGFDPDSGAGGTAPWRSRCEAARSATSGGAPRARVHGAPRTPRGDVGGSRPRLHLARSSRSRTGAPSAVSPPGWMTPRVRSAGLAEVPPVNDRWERTGVLARPSHLPKDHSRRGVAQWKARILPSPSSMAGSRS